MEKTWNELPQKPVAIKAVQNFHKQLEACVNKAGGRIRIEHFIWHIQYHFSDRSLVSKQLFNCNLSACLFF